MELFDSIVSQIAAANQHYEINNSSINHQTYSRAKVFEGNRIYHNSSTRDKTKKITERELRRPWSRLSVNYKTMVILNFIKEFQQKFPTTNVNFLMYELMLNVSQKIDQDIKVDYNPEMGKIVNLYGYEVSNGKVIRSDNLDTYLVNKIKLNLKPKKVLTSKEENEHSTCIEKIENANANANANVNDRDSIATKSNAANDRDAITTKSNSNDTTNNANDWIDDDDIIID